MSKRKPVRTAKFASGVYKIFFEDLNGLCVYPDRINPEGPEDFWITIDPSIKNLTKLDTIIHESLHAAMPKMSEKDVERTATDIARLLWRLGYRET